MKFKSHRRHLGENVLGKLFANSARPHNVLKCSTSQRVGQLGVSTQNFDLPQILQT